METTSAAVVVMDQDNAATSSHGIAIDGVQLTEERRQNCAYSGATVCESQAVGMITFTSQFHLG